MDQSLAPALRDIFGVSRAFGPQSHSLCPSGIQGSRGYDPRKVSLGIPIHPRTPPIYTHNLLWGSLLWASVWLHYGAPHYVLPYGPTMEVPSYGLPYDSLMGVPSHGLPYGPLMEIPAYELPYGPPMELPLMCFLMGPL